MKKVLFGLVLLCMIGTANYTRVLSLYADLTETDILPNVSFIQLAAVQTGCPEYILMGIASAESDFTPTAVGDGGKSLGMFQINEDFRWQREMMVGFKYDPFNVYEAAMVAGLIYCQNLEAFNGNERDAIAAYRQGINGVRKNGRTDWYVDKVLAYKTEIEGRIND